MDRLPRYFPHTRKEWADIREQFTQLYQAEGKKLSDIILILGRQGFYAEEHHYKTYIRKWGLNKKNKESEMKFAHHKLQQRLPKNTVFKIRGRLLTSQDIQHYWKRKSLGPEGLLCDASTPSGVEYRTPSPTLEGNPIEPEMLCDILNDKMFPPDISLEFDTFLDFTQELHDARRSPTLRLLTSPEPLRNAEKALHYSKICIQVCLEPRSHEMDPPSSLQRYNPANVFRNRAFSAIAAMEYRLSPINIKVTQLDMFQTIPALTEQYSPEVFGILLEVLAVCLGRAHIFKRKDLEAFGEQIVHEISLAYTETHPLSLLLRAVDRVSSDVFLLSTRILLASKDTLARVLGFQHPTMRFVLRALWNVVNQTEDWNEARSFATELLQFELGTYETARTDENLGHVLAAQKTLLECRQHLGYLAEAEELVEDGLERCSKVLEPIYRDDIRSEYLAKQGELRVRRGQVAEGIESLNEALIVRSRLFGVADMRVSWIARQLQNLEGILRREIAEIPSGAMS